MMRWARLLLYVLFFSTISEMSGAGVIEGYPDIIVCNEKSFRIVVYIDRQLKDGTVLYRGGGGGVLKVDKNGVMDRPNADCHGKTIEELRKKGRTLEFND